MHKRERVRMIYLYNIFICLWRRTGIIILSSVQSDGHVLPSAHDWPHGQDRIVQLRRSGGQPPKQPAVRKIISTSSRCALKFLCETECVTFSPPKKKVRCAKNVVQQIRNCSPRRYSVCIRQEEGFCCVEFSVCLDQVKEMMYFPL